MSTKSLQTAIIILIILVGVSLLLSFVFPDVLKNILSDVERRTKPSTSLEFPSSGIIKRIVDGDTIILESGQTIRLLNIDTPETVKPNTPVKCYGKEASNFAKSQLIGRVQLTYDQEKYDRYSRLLAFVFTSNVDTSHIENSFNSTIVQNGYGRSLMIAPNTTHKNYFQKLERTAKEQNLGIWGSCPKPFVE